VSPLNAERNQKQDRAFKGRSLKTLGKKKGFQACFEVFHSLCRPQMWRQSVPQPRGSEGKGPVSHGTGASSRSVKKVGVGGTERA